MPHNKEKNHLPPWWRDLVGLDDLKEGSWSQMFAMFGISFLVNPARLAILFVIIFAVLFFFVDDLRVLAALVGGV